jgi:hypothetical protein
MISLYEPIELYSPTGSVFRHIRYPEGIRRGFDHICHAVRPPFTIRS